MKVLVRTITFEEELEHIPEGSHPQQLFRRMYLVHRIHSFYERTPLNERRKALIESCIEAMVESYPDFTPEYDEKYFNLP